jgi:FtsP/CotA-like multicopper oxidase with cupredoxin domain
MEHRAMEHVGHAHGAADGIEWEDDMVEVIRLTNPGLWMAHCHIAEHMRSGMMFSFNVTREQRATSPKEF